MIRQHYGWNVKQAATACGITVASWRDWEHGRSPRDWQSRAAQIAERSGCDFVWLLTGRRPISPWNHDDAGQPSPFDDSGGRRAGRFLALAH
jgi:transcriptional regulator with XRE-family HTH domain